jgi:hypothetical protein
MSIFKSIKKLGSATINTALTPVDLVVSVFQIGEPDTAIERRTRKIARDLEEAYEETFGDEEP